MMETMFLLLVAKDFILHTLIPWQLESCISISDKTTQDKKSRDKELSPKRMSPKRTHQHTSSSTKRLSSPGKRTGTCHCIHRRCALRVATDAVVSSAECLFLADVKFYHSSKLQELSWEIYRCVDSTVCS